MESTEAGTRNSERSPVQVRGSEGRVSQREFESACRVPGGLGACDGGEPEWVQRVRE